MTHGLRAASVAGERLREAETKELVVRLAGDEGGEILGA